MKIFVCVKQVPSTESKIKLLGDQSNIDSDGIKWIVNPYDEFAIEEALKLKSSQAGSTVTIVSLGPKSRVIDSVRTALAMGADDGIVVNCEETIDMSSTAKALSQAILAEGKPDIVFAGKLAIDDNGAGLPQMLAEYLEIPHTTVISSFQHEGDKVTVEREAEGGSTKTYELTLPCVLSTNKGLNTPRYASLPGIMKAKKKPVKDVEYSSLDINPELSKLTYSQYSLPPEKPAVKILEGDSDAQCVELVNLLRTEAKVL